MKKSHILVLAGLALSIPGVIFVWPFLNVISFILMTAGAFSLAAYEKPFKTLRNLSIIAIPFSVLSCAIYITNTGAMQHTIECVVIGINIFFIIYNSYYYTSGIISYAKTTNHLASVRSAMTVWTLFGITVFLYFMAFSSLISIIVFGFKFVLAAFTVYFIYNLYSSACKEI